MIWRRVCVAKLFACRCIVCMLTARTMDRDQCHWPAVYCPADEPAINALDVEGGALLISLPAREIGTSPGRYAGIRRFLASLGPGVITGAADEIRRP